METLRGCEVYDPAQGSWGPCADLNIARAGARVVALADRYLAAVGGCDDVFGRALLLPTVELFDGRSGCWSLLDLPLSTPRTTAAVAALDDRQILIIGGAPSLSSAEVYRVPSAAVADDAQCSVGEAGEAAVSGRDQESPSRQTSGRTLISDIAEGRMGCQAVAIDLPAPEGRYPLCTHRCIVVVGGETGDEDGDDEHWEPNIRQFSSVLVFDAEVQEWRAEDYFPAIPTPRTAMTLCVGPGRIAGHRH